MSSDTTIIKDQTSREIPRKCLIYCILFIVRNLCTVTVERKGNDTEKKHSGAKKDTTAFKIHLPQQCLTLLPVESEYNRKSILNSELFNRPFRNNVDADMAYQYRSYQTLSFKTTSLYNRNAFYGNLL